MVVRAALEVAANAQCRVVAKVIAVRITGVGRRTRGIPAVDLLEPADVRDGNIHGISAADAILGTEAEPGPLCGVAVGIGGHGRRCSHRAEARLVLVGVGHFEVEAGPDEVDATRVIARLVAVEISRARV